MKRENDLLEDHTESGRTLYSLDSPLMNRKHYSSLDNQIEQDLKNPVQLESFIIFVFSQLLPAGGPISLHNSDGFHWGDCNCSHAGLPYKFLSTGCRLTDDCTPRQLLAGNTSSQVKQQKTKSSQVKYTVN
ncbi:hypothetical protein PV326_008106 [Microctonus aethiopoides]|nr:hypothetical protein PV326_008106 [Microctonus aethiopoides]